MARVYVSSTYEDLKECRERLRLLLRRMGHEDVAMEYYVAGDERPVEKCLAGVEGCDLYVGLFAWRYGHVPAEGNPERLSVTEMEYRRARQCGKACLVFLLDEDAPWPRRLMDRDDARIVSLRAELGEKHLAGTFRSAENLAEVAGPAIYKWAEESGHLAPASAVAELDLTAYFAALVKRYQRLDLDALTPPHKEAYLHLQLRLVYVEQSVREEPPPVEMPKEMWERLRREGEVAAEDLPAGVTPEEMLRAREFYFENPSRPVLDVLTDPGHPHTLILGDPGSGKSTLARYVLLSLISEEGDEKLRRAFAGHLPLLIRLSSYARRRAEGKCDTFLEYVEYLSQTDGWGLRKDELDNYLKADGRAVVIFDGLDEIFDPAERDEAARCIVGFTVAYPLARVVVTRRVIGYRPRILAGARFSHFTLQDLDGGQVAEFVDRWYGAVLADRPGEAAARRERILRSFAESASIRQLAGNPMLLTIMAFIGQRRELPRERWELYDHAASVLVHRWDVERHLRDQRVKAPFIGEREKKELLRRLAFRMQSGEGSLAGNSIGGDELQREFESYLSDRFKQSPADATVIARAMIDQFRERNFILSLYGPNLYGFVHRAFLEYFCASAFVHKFEKTREVSIRDLKEGPFATHWSDPSWGEVLRLICGMLDERFAERLVAYLACLIDGFEDDPQSRLLLIDLAAQCFVELRNPDPALVPGLRHLLWNRGERDKDPDVRRKAVEIVGKYFLADKDALRFLRDRAIRDPDERWRVRRAAIMALNRYAGDDRETREVFADRAAHDEDREARSAAIFAITRLRGAGEETILFLHERLAAEGDAYVRGAVARELGEYFHDDYRTPPLLRARAAEDPESLVRYMALRGLVKYFRDEETHALLLDRAANDPSPPADAPEGQPGVRDAALRALAKYWAARRDTLAFLRGRAENDPTPWVREVAKKLAGGLEKKRAGRV